MRSCRTTCGISSARRCALIQILAVRPQLKEQGLHQLSELTCPATKQQGAVFPGAARMLAQLSDKNEHIGSVELRQHGKRKSERLACAAQKREAKACLEAAGKMLKVHAAGRIPLNRKEDEIYKVCTLQDALPGVGMSRQQMQAWKSSLMWERRSPRAECRIFTQHRMRVVQCILMRSDWRQGARCRKNSELLEGMSHGCRGWWRPMRPGWRTPGGRARALGQR